MGEQVSTDRAVDARAPQEVIADTLCDHRYEYDDQRGRATCDCGWFVLVGTRWDHEQHAADAILAALAEAGYVVCREQVGWYDDTAGTENAEFMEMVNAKLGPAWRPVYVPVAMDDRYPQ